METTTQVEPSKERRKRTRESNRLVWDARGDVGNPPNLCQQTRSPERYIGYMSLMAKLIGTKPSCFEEAIEKPIWVDLIVEEYESIVKNNVWEVVPGWTNK